MPELPDVAGYRRLIARSLHRLERVELRDPGVLRNTTRHDLEQAIHRGDVQAVERHGKWLVLRLERSALMIHLGMTGSIVPIRDESPLQRVDRAVLHGDATIALRDPRRLGGIWLAAHNDISDITGPLGPDAARITAIQLQRRMSRRRTAVKTALIDQTVIAGLGNTLSDEILWTARLHPQARADLLSEEQIVRLHAATRDVVKRATRAGTIPRTARWLTSQRSSTQPICPRCATPLQRSPVGGRTALWCPHCQSP